MIKLTRKNNSNILTLDVDKQRDSKEETIQLDLKEYKNSCVIAQHNLPSNNTKVTTSQENHEETILTNLLEKGSMQPTKLQKNTGIRLETLYKKINQLLNEGLISKNGTAKNVKYDITEKGKTLVNHTIKNDESTNDHTIKY
jgi:predicted transcriptional regulator